MNGGGDGDAHGVPSTRVSRGSVVGNRFEVAALAGRGGMGEVWRAHDRTTGETVALKTLNDGVDVTRFAREARVLESLSHPGIVRHVAHGSDSLGFSWLAMEWLDGETLRRRLAHTPLTLEESVTLVRQAAQALAAAHARGIVHRDLKPTNLLLVGSSSDRVKLLDFGVARHPDDPLADEVSTATGVVLGTPGYMAPEQARGDRAVDARADVFSLGCVLFECLTNRRPFVAEHALGVLMKILLEEPPRLTRLCPLATPGLEALVSSMLAKDPAQRPKDAATVVAKLDALLRTEGGAPRAASLHPTLGHSEQRLVSVVLSRNLHSRSSLEDLRQAGKAFGARVEPLAARGAFVALLSEVPLESAVDRATRASRCALAMRATLGPGTAVALATGKGRVGDAGVVGEAIDRAVSMLDDHASPIRLDEATAGLLDPRFLVLGDERGLLLAAEREPLQVTRTLLGAPTPCVGRERELTMLRMTLEECVRESVARAVLVTGVAGVGKSRLRYELLRALVENKELEVWVMRGDPLAAGSAYGLLAPCLRRVANVLDGEPLEAQRRKIRARVGRHLRDTNQGRVAAFVGELARVPFPDRDPQYDPDDSLGQQLRAARNDRMLMADQMRRAFEDWVLAETQANPLLIVADDLHWGDLPTVTALDAALRVAKELPLLVVAFARPEVHDQFPGAFRARDVQELRLGPLTKKACERLARSVLGESVPGEALCRLVERSGGNAFFLEEMVRAMREGKRVDELPATVQAMVQVRLEALSPYNRRVLRAASVFGNVFFRDSVAALLGEGDPHEQPASRASRPPSAGDGALSHALSELGSREVITRLADRRFEGTESFIFRHAIVREAVYQTLVEEDRVLGHRLAAEWLEGAGERDAITVAEHWEKGGEPERAVPWWVRAADVALEANDLRGAIAHAARGMAAGAARDALGALLSTQAEAHRWQGENAEALRCAERALTVATRGDPRWCVAAAEAAEIGMRFGDTARVRALGEDLLHLAECLPLGAPLAVALARACIPCLGIGERALADELLQRALGALDATALDPVTAARIEVARGTRASHDGDPAGYMVHANAAIEALNRAGHRRDACAWHANVGFAQLELGAYEEAVGTLRQVLEIASEMHLEFIVAATRNNLGRAYFRLGDHQRAREEELCAIEVFRAQGNRRLIACSEAYLAAALAAAGELESAEAIARRACAGLLPYPPLRPVALAILADVLRCRARPQDIDECIALATEAVAAADQEILEEGEGLARLSLIEGLLAATPPRIIEAREALARARSRLLSRAAKIDDPRWRACFLERVPEHARTLVLARLHCDAAS